jgi:GT2 family glycosyltransferase
MLDSLVHHFDQNDEILLFDNQPNYRTKEILESFQLRSHIPVRHFESDKNLGFARACNLLGEQAANGRLIFQNPDTILHSFDRASHSSDLVVGAYVYDMNGTRQSSSGRNRTMWNEIKMRWLRLFEFNKPSDELGYVSGVALSISTCMFRELNGFDDRYFMYYEDVDLCFRARERGLQVRVNDRWRIQHVGGSSAKKIRAESEKRSLLSGLVFHTQWGDSSRNYLRFCSIDAHLRIVFFALKRDREGVKTYVEIKKLIKTIRAEASPRR